MSDAPPFQHNGGVRSLKIKQQRGGTQSYIWNLDSSANYSDGAWQIGQTRVSANMVSFTKYPLDNKPTPGDGYSRKE